MDYFASYTIDDPVTQHRERLPVGVRVDEDDGSHDTVFVNAEITSCEEGEVPQLVAHVRVRRVMISKIIDERRSVFRSMDQIDQLEHDVYAAVWDEDSGMYKFDDASCGDLLIFEAMHLREGVALRGFNINKILDDMIYQLGGGSALAVFEETYAAFAQFNVEACDYLEGVGYVHVLARAGLDIQDR